MKTADLKFDLVGNYLALLASLSAANKQQLISRLSASIDHSQFSNGKSLDEIFGSFVSNESADQLIANIYESRRFVRKIEEL